MKPREQPFLSTLRHEVVASAYIQMHEWVEWLHILFMPGTERVINYLGGEAFINQDIVQPFSGFTKGSYKGASVSTGEKLFNFSVFLFKQKHFPSQPFLSKV